MTTSTDVLNFGNSLIEMLHSKNERQKAETEQLKRETAHKLLNAAGADNWEAVFDVIGDLMGVDGRNIQAVEKPALRVAE